jgi:hypothetical protein
MKHISHNPKVAMRRLAQLSITLSSRCEGPRVWFQYFQ